MRGARTHSMRAMRPLAIAALALAVIASALLVALAIVEFPHAAVALALLAAGIAAAWYGLVHRGAVQVIGLVAGGLLFVLFVVLSIADRPGIVLGALVALALAVAAGTRALQLPAGLPRAPRPARPVVIWNPRSGDGKAARVGLADEARRRGIVALELTPGTDLQQLAQQALDGGADAIAMAGGDGSQATVARIAAERGVPYACIPAGTRNHFALDLGVDRADVIGALEALVDGVERRVDLGDVNGRTFVNNVSLGVYGEAVQRAGYRDAKLRTFLATLPDVVGPGARPDLRWRGPDGVEHDGAAAIVVSNNRYRIGAGIGAGSRPRLDEGVLGVVVLGLPPDEPDARTWTAPSLDIQARSPVPAGLDGEAVMLQPPLRFSIRPAALAIRIARIHPGASPSSWVPAGPSEAIRRLGRIAFGRVAHQLPASSSHQSDAPS